MATESDDRPRPGAILGACLLGFLVGEVTATALVLGALHGSDFPGGLSALSRASAPPWWSNVLGLVGLWIGFAGAIYYATTSGRLPAMAHQWRPRASDALFVLLGVGCQVVVTLAYYPFHFRTLNRPVHHLFGAAHGVTFALVALLTTVAAPIVEEWFFRGVVFRALHEALDRVWSRGAVAGAVLLSAILFALAHGEPLQFIGLAFVGVVLAVVVRKTRRLLPSVITHVSFNAVALAAVLAQRSGH